jgi:Tat protein secretion system quality control protein TatD with DNase activity
MKISVTNYNKTYSVESDEDVDAEGLADMFKGLMVSMGFHPKNVDELFNTEYEWFPEDFSNSIVNKWHKDCQEGK